MSRARNVAEQPWGRDGTNHRELLKMLVCFVYCFRSAFCCFSDSLVSRLCCDALPLVDRMGLGKHQYSCVPLRKLYYDCEATNVLREGQFD